MGLAGTTGRSSDPAADRALADAEDVRRQGVTTKKQSTQIVQFITLTSSDGRYDDLYLSNYATINLKDAISRVWARS